MQFKQFFIGQLILLSWVVMGIQYRDYCQLAHFEYFSYRNARTFSQY